MSQLPWIELGFVFGAIEATRSALRECISVEVLMQNEWAENRLLDFNLWAARAGASSPTTSILTHSLINEPAVRTVVLGLLSSLEKLTYSCIEIGMPNFQRIVSY